MLQSRVLKSVLFVLSCGVWLAAAQDINGAVTSDAVELQAVNTPSQSIVVDDASLIEVTSAQPLVSSSLASTESVMPISAVALIPSSTPTSLVLSDKAKIEVTTAVPSSTLNLTPSSVDTSSSNHVLFSNTHDVSSSTSVRSSTSSAGLTQNSNNQDVQTSTSSSIIASSSATNLVINFVTTEAPIVPSEVTSIITSLTTKPTTDPKPSMPNELDERVVLPIRAASNCTTGSNTGLNNLLREARQLLPLERLRNILITAIANDTAVQNLRTLLSSEDFHAKVARLHAVTEYAPLNEYVCKKLQLDYDLYIEFVRLIMGVRLEATPTEINTAPITNARRGVRGLLQDLREALPREQLRALNRRLMLTDRDLITAVRRILSSEFRRLLRAYRQRAEYREVFGALEKAGAPSRPVQQLIATALGWSSLLDFGAETTLINV